MSPETIQAVATFGVPAVLLGYTLHKILYPLVSRIDALTRRIDTLTTVVARREGLTAEQTRELLDQGENAA